MDTSFYQDIKPIITSLLGLSKDAIHIHIGFVSLVITAIVTKRSFSDWKILVPGFLLSVVMELLDMSSDIYRGKLFLTAYLHDLVNTNFIPLVLFLLCFLVLLRVKKTDKVYLP